MPSELFEELRTAEPDSTRITEIQRRLSTSLTPIVPLPSDSILVALWMAAFLVIVVVGALPIGFAGFQACGLTQGIMYYGVTLVAALLLAISVTEQMIPGARRRLPARFAVIFPLIAMLVVVPLLFPVFASDHFVQQGISCIRTGLLCAIPSGVLIGIVIRRGFVTDRVTALITGGALSGLVGFGVLALHCPIQNASHILAWHLGVIAVSIVTGAIMGRLISRPN